jgi:hypothetical protein
MKLFIKLLILVMFVCAPRVTLAADKAADKIADCDCPKLTCDADCEIEQDLAFYTEKCAGGTRVKSCSKPNCIKIENAPAKCALPKSQNAAATEAPAVKADAAREVASVPSAEASENAVVGRVKFIEGTVRRTTGTGAKATLNVGDEIREKDKIETDKNSRLQVLFGSGNILNVTPESEVVITEASDSVDKLEKRRVVLDLIKGKVRNKVNQKYNGEQSYYRVRAGAAVAGVRGTDFTVSLSEDSKDIYSKIETLEGSVELSDASREQKAFVAKGEVASFVAPRAGLIKDKDKAEFVAKGYLTPVTKLSSKEIEDVERETRFAILDENEGKVVASAAVKPSANKKSNKESFVCEKPSAKLNQCAWSCENNPAGEKKCRTDLPSVSCVRRICNANGVWSQPTRLPSSYHEACEAEKSIVKPCDY